jgi:hypothetical protein
MGWLFMAVNLLSATWLIAWTHEQMLASVLLIFLQLFCLCAIHYRLKFYDPLKISGLKITNQFPLSVYLGWISIATIANVSAWLESEFWDRLGGSAVQWTLIMIAIAFIISMLMIVIRRNIYFGLVVVWGLYGIILKRQEDDEVVHSIILIAWIAIGILLAAILFQLVRNIKYKGPAVIYPGSASSIK